jgi:hypothetical protein
MNLASLRALLWAILLHGIMSNEAKEALLLLLSGDTIDGLITKIQTVEYDDFDRETSVCAAPANAVGKFGDLQIMKRLLELLKEWAPYILPLILKDKEAK